MRYLLNISYDGENYSGFQIQPNKTTVQEVIEKVLTDVFKQPIKIIASGRTDAGVSAISQVCHFDYDGGIDAFKTRGYINHLLPNDIRVLSIEQTNQDFHARYSSKRKQYDYLFYIGDNIPVYDKFAVNFGNNLKIDEMINACQYLIGEHDFTSFCASNTEVKDKVRIIDSADIIKIDDYLYKFSIVGNGFLYNMVRIIMGTLVDIGRGKLQPIQMANIIQSKDRNNAGKTAPAKGLYLKKVTY